MSSPAEGQSVTEHYDIPRATKVKGIICGEPAKTFDDSTTVKLNSRK